MTRPIARVIGRDPSLSCVDSCRSSCCCRRRRTHCRSCHTRDRLVRLARGRGAIATCRARPRIVDIGIAFSTRVHQRRAVNGVTWIGIENDCPITRTAGLCACQEILVVGVGVRAHPEIEVHVLVDAIGARILDDEVFLKTLECL